MFVKEDAVWSCLDGDVVEGSSVRQPQRQLCARSTNFPYCRVCGLARGRHFCVCVCVRERESVYECVCVSVIYSTRFFVFPLLK